LANDKIIKVGIIGASRFAELGHISGYKSHEGVEIVAICSRTRPKAEEMAKRHGIPHVFTDYKDLLKSEEIDVVSVVTPNYLHYPMTMEAIEAGKHVICEKPLGMGYAQTREMYERAESKGLKNMVGFTWRFTPIALKMSELVKEGYLGRIFHISATTLVGGVDSNFGWGWTKEKAGTGFISMAGSHLIDLAMSWAGGIREVSANAETHIKERRIPGSDGMGYVDVDDSTAFLAKFESGAQGIFHLSALASGRKSFMRIEAYGDRGSLIHEFEADGPMHLIGSGVRENKFEPISIPDRLRQGLALQRLDLSATIGQCWRRLTGLMVDAIRYDGRPVPGFYEGMRSQEVIDAVMRSSQEKRWVELPL
jgi:predicted dehydrogenase